MPHATRPVPKPVVLVVLDGFGVSLEERGNAVRAAKTPNLTAIEQRFPFTTLQASGIAVGLPWGEAGNSEVGHLTMGAGRVIYHHLPRISVAIEDGSFFTNPAWEKILAHANARGRALHLIGLVSSGSVHSYLGHLEALLELANRAKPNAVYLHAITDGRDAPPEEGASFLRLLGERLASRPEKVLIASLIGRFFAMDRDGKWGRIQKAYELLTAATGRPFENPVDYLKASYRRGNSDEFIEPAYLVKDGKPLGRIEPGDGLIFFNFREDSMRELIAAFAKDGFSEFPRSLPNDLAIATMTQYAAGLAVEVAFPPIEITWPLGRVLADAGKKQLRIAESEKYAHVTYFFNGGREKPFPGEERLLIPSLGMPHPDEEPAMRAPEVTAEIIENLERYDFILANFANADMVGHTGNFAAVTAAVETLDTALGQLAAAVATTKGLLLVTADHGSAERKINFLTGEPVTEHSPNPVPLYLIGGAYERPAALGEAEVKARKTEPGGILTDIAPTVLELMGLAKPAEMTGKSLLPLLTPDGS